MSTSLVHVLTVIGDGASATEAACEELLSRRIECDEGAYGSDDWSKEDHRVIEALCRSLIGAAHSLPIVYYSRYLDGSTVADSRFSLLQWPDERRRQISGDWFGVAFYPSQFREDLLAQISKCRRRRHYRDQNENRWYLEQLREALSFATWVESPSLVVSISQVLGPSRGDEEILDAVESPIRSIDAPSRCEQASGCSRADGDKPSRGGCRIDS
jgi:hypothetical protein